MALALNQVCKCILHFFYFLSFKCRELQSQLWKIMFCKTCKNQSHQKLLLSQETKNFALPKESPDVSSSWQLPWIWFLDLRTLLPTQMLQ